MTQTQTVITATEAYAQGTSPWALLSVAKFNGVRNPRVAQRVRQVAAELAAMQGITLRRKRGANDNRRHRRAA